MKDITHNFSYLEGYTEKYMTMYFSVCVIWAVILLVVEHL
jgi:hypothetical protein